MPQLLFHKHSKNYFLFIKENENVCCSTCDKVLELASSLVVQHSYSKIKGLLKSYYCSNKCSSATKKNEQDEYKVAYLTTVLMDDCVVVDDRPTPTAYGSINTFQAVNLKSTHTIDKTVHAGRESLEGATIGNKEFISHNPKDHKNLTEKGFNKEIEELTTAKPLIEEKKVKQIESNRQSNE